MHKKISVGLALTITVATLIVTAVITTAVTMNIYSGLIADLPAREEMYDSLAEADNLIRTHYYGAVEEESLHAGLTEGYLGSLTVGRNTAMTADEYSDYKLRQTGTDKDGNTVSSVTWEKFASVGYIRISDFIETTPDEFRSACDALQNDAVTGIVIDVRDTDSINIEAAAAVIDRIVPLATEGTQAIATAVDKNGKNAQIFSADADSIDLPFSVLVNENTVGAGELLACDLRDFGKATVVGKTTAGNGTYQQIFELSDGGALVLTTARLLPYTSDSFDITGVSPDYEVEPASQPLKDLNADPQFMQAYASVSTMQ